MDINQDTCEHKFVNLSTHFAMDSGGSYNTTFKRVDIFFCEKCLLQKEVIKSEDSRGTPIWYKH